MRGTASRDAWCLSKCKGPEVGFALRNSQDTMVGSGHFLGALWEEMSTGFSSEH